MGCGIVGHMVSMWYFFSLVYLYVCTHLNSNCDPFLIVLAVVLELFMINSGVVLMDDVLDHPGQCTVFSSVSLIGSISYFCNRFLLSSYGTSILVSMLLFSWDSCYP